MISYWVYKLNDWLIQWWIGWGRITTWEFTTAGLLIWWSIFCCGKMIDCCLTTLILCGACWLIIKGPCTGTLCLCWTGTLCLCWTGTLCLCWTGTICCCWTGTICCCWAGTIYLIGTFWFRLILFCITGRWFP